MQQHLRAFQWLMCLPKAFDGWRRSRVQISRSACARGCSHIPDVETPPMRKRRFARDGLHTMGPSRASARSMSRASTHQSIASTHKDDLLAFYDEEVRKLQDSAGDNDHAPIAGNLYRYLALRSFAESSGLYQSNTTADCIFFVGLFFAIFVQICAPMMIMVWAVYQIEFANEDRLPFCLACEWKYVPQSNEYGVSNLAKRILGFIFIVMFCANGIYIMDAERVNMIKTLDMAAIFDAASERTEDQRDEEDRYPPTNWFWLWLDPIVNIWCCAFCAGSLLLVFTCAEEGPKGLVYDAFGLLFLVNLDDIGGDLAFLADKWDEDQFGDIFGVLADAVSEDAGTQGSLLDHIREERQTSWTPDDFYMVGKHILSVQLIVLPICWIFFNFKARTPESDMKYEIQEQHISNLTATVNMLQGQMAELTAIMRAWGAVP